MLVLVFIAILLVAGAGVAYRFSPVRAATARASAAIDSVAAPQAELLAEEERTGQGVAAAARQLENAVRTERLRALPIEDIKRYASGLRLQALHDAGLHTVLDLQGWDTQRLTHLRGVGPKSAGGIASAVAALTRDSNGLPIASPSPPFLREADRMLMQAVFRECAYDDTLSERKAALGVLCGESAERLASLQRDSTLGVWLLGLGRSERLHRARALADSLTEELETKPETVLLRQQLAAFLEERRVQASRPIAQEALIAAYREQPRLYAWLMSKALGHANPGPRPAPIELAAVSTPLSPSAAHAVTLPTPEPARDAAGSEEVSLAPKSSSKNVALEAPVPFDRLGATPARNATEAIQQLNRLQAVRAGATLPAPRDELVSMVIGERKAESPFEYALPERPAASASTQVRWIAPGRTVTIQGVSIARGYFYCGPSQRRGHAFVVDPLLPAKPGSIQVAGPDLLARSYAAFSPAMRLRYLQWLSNMGADAHTLSGFVLLYFQGLENRALELIQSRDADVMDEARQILGEIRRVEVLFRGTDHSISPHADALLALFAAKAAAAAAEPPPLADMFERSYELPFGFRLGLGCMLKDRRPVPAEWALRWVYLEPTLYLRTAATRCPEEFEAAFRWLYAQRFGDGIVIESAEPWLSLTYQRLWPSGDEPSFVLELTGIANVAALAEPQKALRALVEQATAMIDAYSRFVGPDDARAGTLEALLLLPERLWTEEAAARMDHLRRTRIEAMGPNTCEALCAALGCQGDVTPNRLLEIVRRLQGFRIGFEPDVLAGARKPKPADPVILFPLTKETEEERTGAYQAATLSVGLAAILTLADGHASDAETASVDALIASWEGLAPDLRTRLRAHYRLCLQQPATVASLKSRLEALSAEHRRKLVVELSQLAAADGVVSPEEVKLLERVYRILGIEAQALYSDLHGTGSPARHTGTAGAFLDFARIREKREESSEVGQLLAAVFAEDTVQAEVEPVPAVAIPPSTDEALPGLSVADREFLALLLLQAEWPRAELLRAAATRQIMLDGTLERINDAAVDSLGDVLIDGDDPIYVQQSLLENAE